MTKKKEYLKGYFHALSDMQRICGLTVKQKIFVQSCQDEILLELLKK